MAVQQPYMNPVRFYNPSKAVDYSTYWPHPDNVLPRTLYQRGQDPTEYYREHLVNKVIRFQLRFDSVSDTDIEVYKDVSGTWTLQTTITKTNIIPSGWTGFDIYKFEYTPSSEGLYQFRLKGVNFRTDPILVVSREKFKKGLVQLEYWNTENDYDMIFWDGGTQNFSGLIYLSGMLLAAPSENEVSVFVDDPGIVKKLKVQGTPRNTLKIADLHWSYASMIDTIFKCDQLKLNGVFYQNQESPEIELIENSDLVNITVNLNQTNESHFYHNF